MPEPNQAYWRGIRPTDPPENIPVDIKVCGITLPVGIASVIGNLPVDIKAHTVNTPIVPAAPPQNIPVDVKAVTGNVPIIPSTPAQNIPVDIKSMTGNMPVDVKAHTVNTPVDVKSHDVDTPVKNSWVLQDSDSVQVLNPVINTILLDSGQLAAGYYDVTLSMSVDVAISYLGLQHRNAANNATLHNLLFMVSVGASYVLYIKNWYFAANERLRVELFGTMAAWAYGGLWWTQRS